MAADGRVTFEWVDGIERTFRLGMREIRLLQEKTGYGLEALQERIVRGLWLVDELRETERLGLIGAGMPDSDAEKLLKEFFDDRPKIPHKRPAYAIVAAALVGVPEDPLPAAKKTAAEEGQQETQTADSPSPQSTATASASGSRRRKSTK